MKLLILGASGLVGSALTRQAAEAGHSVTGVVGRWSGALPGANEIHVVDLSDLAATIRLVESSGASAILNAAAVSEPAACEAAPDLSQVLNVDLPAALAGAVARSGGRLIHLSSEQVFDGTQPPYAPDAAPNPLNLYGRQKLASEQAVVAGSPRAAVVRAPLLLGNSLSGRRSVHEKLFELWAGGGTARLYADEFRQACTADNLAAALLELAARPEFTGVLHWAGRELVSRYELGVRIAGKFGVPTRLVERVWRGETPAAAAKRAPNLGLQLSPLDGALRVQPESVADALAALRRPAAFHEWRPAS